jgi:hypothetical protein
VDRVTSHRKHPWTHMSLIGDADVVEPKRGGRLHFDIGAIGSGSCRLESSPNHRLESHPRSQVLQVEAVEREECSMKSRTSVRLGADCCAWTEAARWFGNEERKEHVRIDREMDTPANSLADSLLRCRTVTDWRRSSQPGCTGHSRREH